MAKKIFIVGFAMIILCLCCGICFAADDNSVSLGNEMMQSIDKTGESMENVVSGNWVNDMGNTVKNAGDNMANDTRDMTDTNNQDNNNDNNNNRDMTGTTDYNTTRTTAEGTTTGAANTMSTTTWMWIILVVAAIIIIAAIWYYATQNND